MTKPSGRRLRLPSSLRTRPATLIRRALAVGLFLLAAALAAHPATADGERGEPALVFARDLPLGAPLGPDDVRRVDLPAAHRPAGTLSDPALVAGRRLVGVARAGEPVTDTRLAGPHLAPPGTVTVPVRLAEPDVTPLLHPGIRVDVVSLTAAEQRGQVLADDVSVLSVITSPGSSRDGPPGVDGGPLVLLAVRTGLASDLAAVSLAQPVTVTLR
ncbi:SAF domain-containing protein [Prauserella oleivorans]|uniref:SAF domain-containing protein n=1 Tax=Prauserella oleivorans TaxID=1478153 RepID=A0ABW5WIE6_9PSEU